MVAFDDVAAVHVAALSNNLIMGPVNEFVAVGAEGVEGIVWDNALEIVRRRFPGTVSADGHAETARCRVDGGRLESVFEVRMGGLRRGLWGWWGDMWRWWGRRGEGGLGRGECELSRKEIVRLSQSKYMIPADANANIYIRKAPDCALASRE